VLEVEVPESSVRGQGGGKQPGVVHSFREASLNTLWRRLVVGDMLWRGKKSTWGLVKTYQTRTSEVPSILARTDFSL
jgi:hypothetical protein